MGTSYLGGSDFFAGLAGLFTDGLRIRSLETEIAELDARSRTVSGPALGDTMTRLTRLRSVMESLHTLDRLEIHRADINTLRRTTVERLLAGTENPPRETEYREGVRLLQALQRYQALEARRDAFVTQVEALYPQPRDELILFRLDYSHLNPSELDRWRYPTVASLNDLRVLQTYRTLANSSDPNDQRIAASVRDLFERMRTHTGPFGSGTGTATLADVETASRDLEAVFNNADVQTFFQRLGTAERDAMMANEGARARLYATQSLEAFRQFPGLVTALTRYDTLVGATQTVDAQQRMLAGTTTTLLGRGERYLEYLRAQPAGADRDREIEAVQAHISSLREVEGRLNMSGVTREDLSAVAGRLATVAQAFQPLEERYLRYALTRMIGQVEGLEPSTYSLAPVREALAAITDSSPATPADRLTAYRNVASLIDQAATVRLIDVRIRLYEDQLRQVEIGSTIAHAGLHSGGPEQAMGEAIGDLVDSWLGGHMAEDRRRLEEGIRNEPEDFRRMLREYRELRTRVTSSDPAIAAAGRRELQQLEGAAIQPNLAGRAETAQMVNMITIGAGIILVAALTAEFGGLALAAGAESLLAGTTLTVATQQFLVGAVYYTSMAVIFTGVSRDLNERAFGPSANQHGFFTDLLINAAMFGVVGGAMRGMGRLISGYVERVAIANLERTGALVLAREGGAAGAGTMSRFAMETGQRAAVEAEMARIMEGFTARLGSGAAMLGTEYVMFNLFELARTAGELAARGDPHPVDRAMEAVLSPRGQARIAAFLVAMRALNSVAEPFTAPIRDRLHNILGERFLQARMAELERNVAELSRDWNEGRLTDPMEMVTRSRALLEQRQRILMEAHARETTPSEDLEREFGANERALQQLDRMADFLGGVDRVFGETNAFGVRPFSEDGSVFTYRPGQSRRIMDEIARLPGGVDRANVRVHPNGMIEVPFLASPFMPEPRTVFLIPANAAGRRPSGAAIIPRPATATP